MNVDAVTNLKAKFISDYEKFRVSLYKGIKCDSKMLKLMTCVIEHPAYFNKNIYEYLMSYEHVNISK